MSIAILFLLLLVGFGAVVVWTLRAVPTPDDGEPEPAAAPTIRAVLRFAGELHVVDARFTHARHEDGATLLFEIDDEDAGVVRLTLDTRDHTGSLQIAGQRGTLFDRPELVMSTMQTASGEQRIPGIQAEFSLPMAGPFWRLRTVFLGFVDEPATTRLVADLLREPAGPDAVIAWTLDGATRFVRGLLEARPGVTEVQIAAPGELAYELDGSEARVSLHNVFSEVRHAEPDEGRALLERFVGSMVVTAPLKDREQVTLRIYPGPAPFVFRMADGHTQAFASFALAGDLVAVFMQDTPESMRSLQDADLDALIPRDEALAAARTNLVREVGRIHVRGEGPVFMLIAGGNYEASLVTVPAVWEALEGLLDGPPLVGIPARDLVFVTGDTGPERRAQLQGYCGDLDQLAYAISDGVYAVHDRGARLERVL